MTDSTKAVVRVVHQDDAVLSQLAEFRCADPDEDHQVEVEDWIHDNLALWPFDPHAAESEPQLLATIDDQSGKLIGLFAHEHAVLQSGDTEIPGELIVVAAVASDYQKKRDVENRRYSDIVMSSGLQAIAARTPPERRVFGFVHIDNDDSFRLLGRHNMTRRIRRDEMTEFVTTN